jgi:hypothetical protein
MLNQWLSRQPPGRRALIIGMIRGFALPATVPWHLALYWIGVGVVIGLVIGQLRRGV